MDHVLVRVRFRPIDAVRGSYRAAGKRSFIQDVGDVDCCLNCRGFYAATEKAGLRVRKNAMSPTNESRQTGRHLSIAAVVVLVAITQYAGLKGAVRDFNHGFRDGVGGLRAEQAPSTVT
jgi:hypothetical protein